MPRKSVPASPEFPYHICARCLNKEWFKIPVREVWDIMEDYLYFGAHNFGIQIHAFVLMSNHYHLLLTAPRANLSQFLNHFMRETSKEIGRASGRINQVYGGRNHKTILPTDHYFMNTYKYIYRNPVRAGLSDFVEAYPYSTLHGLLGLRKIFIPIINDRILFNNGLDQSALKWLNTPSQITHEIEMRKALRKAVFKFGQTRDKKRSDLETSLL